MEKRFIFKNRRLNGITVKQGFTIIELLIVIAIIGTLAAIAVPVFSNYTERAKRTAAIAGIRVIEKDVLAFFISNNQYPADLGEIGFAGLLDPWGSPYQYLPVQGTPTGKLRKDHFMVPVNSDFDLYSMGPDGKSQAPFTAKDSRDDIVRANNGQFVGPVEAY
jgi:general secretion pathway protein G